MRAQQIGQSQFPYEWMRHKNAAGDFVALAQNPRIAQFYGMAVPVSRCGICMTRILARGNGTPRPVQG